MAKQKKKRNKKYKKYRQNYVTGDRVDMRTGGRVSLKHGGPHGLETINEMPGEQEMSIQKKRKTTEPAPEPRPIKQKTDMSMPSVDLGQATAAPTPSPVDNRTITKMPWIKIVDMKACQTNCQCLDKLKRLVVKPPLNIIDETFFFKILSALNESNFSDEEIEFSFIVAP